MSSESHQACLDGRVAIEMDEVNRNEEMSFIKYKADESHYKEVLSLALRILLVQEWA